MFVKKLVDRATKKPGENLECLKPEDVDPRLAFHYGLPSSAAMLAYDPAQKIFAVSTKNGLIKLFGKDNTQALLQSNDAQPSKFLQFIHNQGVLLNVTSKDQIEVWDIDKKILCHVVDFDEVITSFVVMQHCFFILIGNHAGNVMVWKLNKESCQMEKMKYWIPFVASHGCINKGPVDRAVTYILPQPTAENKRILLIFADGSMILWGIRESKAVFTVGNSGNTNHLSSQETKRVTSTCWICPFGTKFAVGYDSGDILIYTVSNLDAENGSPVSGDSCKNQIVNTSKINLGYRLEKTPIASLKWVYSGGKANRLYVIGASDDTSTNLVQVILLNEDAESRTVKVGLQLPEPCIDLEIISCPNETSKHYQQYLLLLGKSGLIYAYDDHSIEKCLLQSQSKSSVTLPIELMIKLPISASTTTTAQFITNHFNSTDAKDEDYNSLLKNFPSVLPSEAKHVGLPQFTGFAKVKNLYITGHDDGTIKFWDVTCPLLIPLVSLTQQNDDESSQSGIAVTAIHYCTSSRLLFSGDKNGMVCIYQFKPEPFPVENGFFSLSGSSKKGSNHMIHSVKCIKVNGSVLSFDISSNSRHLAVGSEQGHISVIDVEGQAILYQKKIATELSADVISLKFESPNIQGFEKNVLLIMTKDSSLWALDADTGNTLSSSSVHPKKPSRSLFMQTLEASRGSSTEEAAQKQQVLLCSEKAVYIYSLTHIIQGVKKVINKKKFNSSSCFWASTICSTSSSGLILFFSCGRIEIRSLPDLTVVKETTLRSFTCPPLKQNAFPEFVVCSSADGEVIMIRSNQEVAVASMLLENAKYRLLDSLSRVYDENLTSSENATTTPSVHLKEKKKGMFGTLFKDVTGSKMNHGAEPEAVDGRTISEELTKHFAVSNFPTQSQGFVNTTVEDENNDLDIDDIDLDDQEEKPKGNNVRILLNTQKLASKFQSFKGRLKQIAVKNEKSSAQEEPQYEKAETVDQIKKKYGYSSSSPTCESSAAKMAESKLIENVKKLQGISLKTTEMQDNAQTFSSMAKETLRLAEQKNITK